MKKLFYFIFVFLLITVILFFSGYRFTARTAAEAHSLLNKGSKLVQIVKSNFGEVYIYKTNDYYLTIIPEKKGFLWLAPYSISTKDINDKNDSVRTIGWASSSGPYILGTVLVVEVQDDNVAYIEAGPAIERVKKKVEKGKYIVFEWDKAYNSHNINPIALSQDGTQLYMYGYDPATPNYLDQKELRWHKIQ